MTNLLSRAIDLLHGGGYTCVLCDQTRVLTDTRRGIAPLLERFEAGEDLRGFCVADKIIGRAAAMLLILGGVSAAHGDVMSTGAKALLESRGIAVSYETLTERIVNRRGDGLCPMEQAAAPLTDPADAPRALRAALDQLTKQ